jgi:hypothetical protein
MRDGGKSDTPTVEEIPTSEIAPSENRTVEEIPTVGVPGKAPGSLLPALRQQRFQRFKGASVRCVAREVFCGGLLG